MRGTPSCVRVAGYISGKSKHGIENTYRKVNGGLETLLWKSQYRISIEKNFLGWSWERRVRIRWGGRIDVAGHSHKSIKAKTRNDQFKDL